MQIQISWLLQKPTDLDLHCLQRQGISGFSRTKVKSYYGRKYWRLISQQNMSPLKQVTAQTHTDLSISADLLTQQIHKVAKMLLQHRCNVIMLQRCCNDIALTLCVGWVQAFFSVHCIYHIYSKYSDKYARVKCRPRSNGS